jgi:hypothetical protein
VPESANQKPGQAFSWLIDHSKPVPAKFTSARRFTPELDVSRLVGCTDDGVETLLVAVSFGELAYEPEIAQFSDQIKKIV